MTRSAALSHQHSQPKLIGSHRESTRPGVMAGVVALLLLLPPFAYAQQSNGRPASQHNQALSITPHVGLYMPVGSLVADHTVRLRPVTSIALGSRVALPLSDRFALEGSLSWSPHLVAQSDWRETIDLEGGTWFGSARARAQIVGDSNQSDAVATISAGLGVVHRYGDAWNGFRGMTDAALVLGGGLRYVEREIGITFTVDAEGYFSRTGFTDASGHFYGGRLQKDFIVTFGTSINLRK